MATNRFLCEVCNKGFQREQNLQLHRRGHNLPWKLKQKTNKDPVRKKVYLCPEPTCVHHDPARALGDLTGIKKHFSRKHGEKKFKCDKCSKRYAVQSDWKAHSKTCGTREYRCDCGTLFSRRDSFITHRAFCDALAQESARHPAGGGGSLTSHLFGGGGGQVGSTSTTLVGIHMGLSQLSNNNQLMMGPSLHLPDHHHHHNNQTTTITPAADILHPGSAAQFNHLFGPTNPFRGPNLQHNNNNNNNNFYFSSADNNQHYEAQNPGGGGGIFSSKLFQGGGQLNQLPVNFQGSSPGPFNLHPGFFPNQDDDHHNNNNDSTVLFGGPKLGSVYNSGPGPSPSLSPGMSATALLQKAAQMGSTTSSSTATATALLNKGGKSSSSSSPPPKLFSTLQYGDQNDQNSLHNLMMNSLNDGPCWVGPRTVGGQGQRNVDNKAASNSNSNNNNNKSDGMTRDFLGVGEIVRSMSGGRGFNSSSKRENIQPQKDGISNIASNSALTTTCSQAFGGGAGNI